MSINQIPEYTGEVPVIGQEQNEFNTNTKDQLNFFNQQAVNINTFATQANALGDSVEVSEQNASSSAAAAEAAASGLDYKGLWPDTGGSANKGETWQTQTGGTPTGRYFTALQNTTVDPVGDNVNWRSVISGQSLGEFTNYQSGSVANATNGNGQAESKMLTVGGDLVSLALNQRIAVDDYYGGATPNNSGVLFFKVVAFGTGTADGGKYIDVPGGLFQLEQNLPNPCCPEMWGAKANGTDDDSLQIQNHWNYCKQGRLSSLLSPKTYLHNSSLVIPIGVNICGGGISISDQSFSTELRTENAGLSSQISTEQTNAALYQNSTISGIAFVAQGSALDVVPLGIDVLAKGVKVNSCYFSNQDVGIKSVAVETWIEGNYFNSNNDRCIDVDGECHVNFNHGYPGGAAGSGQRAILVRGSNNEVMGNKFFGDGSGSGADYGIEIWGFGNQVIGNVFDAFVKSPYYLHANVAGVDVQNNTIVGNAYASGKVGSLISSSAYLNARNANITSNVINLQANNKRGDRQTEHMYYLEAVGAFTIDDNSLLGGVDNSQINTSVIAKVGSGVGSYNKVDIAGYRTVRGWEQSVSNGDVINHNLDVTPSSVTLTPRNNNVYSLAYDNETATTIRVLGRDNAGALISSETVRFRASREYA